jgi:hypothetical protein
VLLSAIYGPNAMQLDIFEHSRDTSLRNDVLQALEVFDVAAARAAQQRLQDEFAQDHSLPLLAVLIAAAAARSTASLTDHDALRDARGWMDAEVEPAAMQLFGERAADPWVASLRRELAQRAGKLVFRSERSDDHAAPLWLRAGEWAHAARAVEMIASWRRIPAPLAWMAEARHRMAGLQGDAASHAGSWALLVELAWLSPARFDALAHRLADPALGKLLKKFGADFEGVGTVDDLAWFPAWALTEQAELARWLSLAQPSRQTDPERAMRLILDLLSLERQGRHHDLVDRRKQLRQWCLPLFSAYMRTR